MTGWKQEIPVFRNVHSQVLQNAQLRVDLAFQSFFRRVKSGDKKAGYPRFRSRFRYDSLCFPQYPGGAELKDGKLFIRKIGTIRLNLHRPIPPEATIKTTTIRKTSTGKWFAFFSVEVPLSKPLDPVERAVGIDLGLESFLTTDQGVKAKNPRFFRKSEKALAKVQRRFARTKKGTPERRFRRKAVARVHEKIANQRSNYAHKISRKLVDHFGIIVFEDLKPSRMIKNHCLAKSIADVAWTQIRNYTTYKAEEAGRTVVLVNPAYTSQDCSRCSFRVKKKLSERTHNCPSCGLSMDRDQNAALNILRLGLQSLSSNEL